LVDQNTPPAGLIAIATRSLPVGAIWSRSASALAGIAIVTERARTRPAMRGKDELSIGYSSQRLVIVTEPLAAIVADGGRC
jgi:hypothetical protein